MVEVGCAVARDDLLRETHLLADLRLEGSHICGLVAFGHPGQLLLGQLVPLHVEDGCGAKFGGHEALIELLGFENLGHKGVRDGFTCLVMLGIFSEYLRLEGPVLVELREGLDKVAGHAGTAH